MRQNGPHLPDWINLILGFLLVISPWLFGFTATTSAMWNAVILGVIIAALSILAISAYARWEEWVNALAGLWVLFSPWFLGFSGVASAAWTHFIIGNRCGGHRGYRNVADERADAAPGRGPAVGQPRR